MSLFHQNILAGASGAGGAGAGLYVDDVFSTFLYTGNGGTQTITNGIDLDGEGGLVWIKPRDIGTSHTLVDSERGSSNVIYSNLDVAQETKAVVTGFNSDGFGVSSNVSGYHLLTNYSDSNYVSWTFRKAPGFFDVVTYTGNGTAGRTVSHSLGSVPGAIWVKELGVGDSWGCYHRSTGNTKATYLNSNGTPTTGGTPWNNTTPTSTEFTVGSDNQFNGSGRSYVAYIFAHDDQSFGTNSDEAIIKCDSYTGTGSESTEIDLGFQPQWLLIKNISTSSTDWMLVDMMRGLPVGEDSAILKPNRNYTESSNRRVASLTPTGFKLGQSTTDVNGNGNNYIYIAIRRPHKPPSAGTDVFTADAEGLNAQAGQKTFHADHYVDLVLHRQKNSSASGFQWFDRLRGGGRILKSNNTNAELSQSSVQFFDIQDGVKANASGGNFSSYLGLMFKRAPGFFDIVAYTGNGANRSISHNLTVPPELLIVKSRTNTHDWFVYAKPVGNNKQLSLNLSDASASSSRWQSTHPTSTQFYINLNSQSNGSGSNYIAYLFASVNGISKIGTYSGSSSAVTVDCGFSSGPRFIMIKATNRSEPWYVFDSARGIVSGNDPHLQLNTTSTENTGDDVIDPTSSGFTVNTGYGSGFNESGNTYLFFAIA